MCDGPSDIEAAPEVTRSITSSYGAGDAVKEFLLDGTSALTRSEINEYVLSLEKMNPTAEPAYSKLLNGVWEVKSTGFGSPGLVGLQVLKALSSDVVDSVVVTISSVAPRVTAKTTLRIATAQLDVSVTTDIEAVGIMRLKETASAVKFGTLDVPISSLPIASSLPSILTSREIFITYLDEDLLIARDALGSPEILVRKAASFAPSSDVGVPAVDNNSGAPGV